MSYAAIPILPEDKELMDWTSIHRSACQKARDTYLETYGVDYHADPKYKTGNERHKVWLDAYDTRFSSLIINPHQA